MTFKVKVDGELKNASNLPTHFVNKEDSQIGLKIESLADVIYVYELSLKQASAP